MEVADDVGVDVGVDAGVDTGVGAAVGDVPPGSRSVPPIPVLAESIHTVRWSMPWLSSTERCLWRQLMSQSHHYELYLAESTGCLWWSEPAMIVMW